MSPKPASVEFDPVRIGRRRRRIDPTVLGLLVVTAALAVAVVKPWGSADTAPRTGPVPTGGTAPTSAPTPAQPDRSPASAILEPPSWADVAAVMTHREAWGIRAIILSRMAIPSSGVSPSYVEQWAAVDREEAKPALVDPRQTEVMALGVTFPATETPHGVRIWLDHGGNDFEWIDARPVNDVPARGAYLFVRPSPAGTPPQAWGPGRYRVDVLVGPGIRRITVHVLDRTGALPAPEPWPEAVPEGPDVPGSGPAGLPVGLFAWVSGTAVPLAAGAGPQLDELGAWLDLDRGSADTGAPARSFVARAHQPRAEWLGVVLPPGATVRSAVLQRLAPFADSVEDGGTMTTTSGNQLSFVAFARPGGSAWRPGVYALRVEYDHDEGPHDLTWHVELRPGPVRAEPLLLSATRAWVRFAGSSGILFGTTASVDGESGSSAIRLLDIVPQATRRYEGMSGSRLFGCGETLIQGGPTIIGFVGPETADLAPVTSVILFPFAENGPLPVLTAAGAVPGLALTVPLHTSEFGGPASYGFRAGSAPDATGYTICIGMPPGR